MASIQQQGLVPHFDSVASAGELVDLMPFVDTALDADAARSGPEAGSEGAAADAGAGRLVGALEAGALAQPLRAVAVAVDGGESADAPADALDTAQAVAQLLAWTPAAGAAGPDADAADAFTVEWSAPEALSAGDGDSGAAVEVVVADGSAQRPEPGPLPVVWDDGDVGLSADLGAPLPVYTVGQIGDYLKQGFWNWFDGGVNYRSFNMGTTGTGPNSGILYYNYSGFSGISGAGTDTNGISAARQALVDDALDYIGELFNINFIATTSTSTSVDLFFKDNDSGAYSNSVLHGSGNGTANHRYIDYSWVNIEPGWSGGTSTINDYTYQTLIHEIGHAIGLGHGGQYNGTATYVTDTTTPGYGNNTNIYLNDSWQQSIMSYISQDENTYIPAATTYSFVISFMAGDFEALRDYYGSGQAFNGNTVYGFNTNIAVGTSEVYANLATWADETAFSIIDSSGVDTVDFSGYAANQRIDITIAADSSTTGTISNIGGLTGNMTLGVGTVIENAVGGSGSDTIIGNTSNNVLTGNGGNDTITGGSGNDTMNGGTGADNLNGGLGDDVYIVDNAGDVAAEAAGGIDTVQSSITWTLSTNLENLTLTGVADINGTGNSTRDNLINGNGGNNTLSGLGGNDSIEGGTGDDVLLGGDGNDTLAGESGTDSVNGGAGDDLILFTSGHFYDSVDGGAGIDTLDATAVSRNGDTFDFELGIISGYPGGQTVAGIEIFRGGSGNETIISSGSGGTYYGNGGDDLMVSEIGSETMDGGAGIDTIDHSRYSGDYVLDMVSGATNFFFESYVNFEHLISGAGNDSITGTAGDNDIRSQGGNDTVVAGGGEDTVYGGEGNDLLQGGFVTDFVYGEAGDDTIQVLAGEFYDNTDGGSGTDTLDHSASTYSGTTFDFELQQITGAGVNATAFLRNIEVYQDGSGDNTIVSAGLGHSYFGNAGDDYMIAEIGGESMDGGVGGTDTIDLSRWNGFYVVDLSTGSSNYGGELFTNFENLISGNGADDITGTAGSNVIATNGGNDTVNAGAGMDTVSTGAGDDTLIDTQNMVAAESDVYDGGDGNDTLIHELNWVSSVAFNLATGWATLSGANRDQLISIENLTVGGAASIVGSAANNVLIVNGSGANDIQGGAGNDTIDAGGGDDTVDGGSGNDSVNAGAGNDTIHDTEAMFAGTADDVYDGGDGIDTLVHDLAWVSAVEFNLTTGFSSYLGNRDQLINIENLTVGGSAVVIGSAVANVLIVNGTGNNLIRGEGGNDTIDGGGGNDTVDGGAGVDSLVGGEGIDSIVGGAGIDDVDAGDGDDLIVFTAGDDYDNVAGGVGNDTLDASAVNRNGDVFDFDAGTISGFNGVRTVSAIEVFQGGQGDETIVSDGGGNRYYGNGGDDYMIADLGDETMDGGAGGSDTIDLTRWNGPYTLDMNSGVPVEWPGEQYTNFENLISGNGDDAITGTAAANLIRTTGGNDTVMGGAGNDVVEGGDGDDNLDGGADTDTASYAGAGSAVAVSLALLGAQATGGAGSDVLADFENLTGSAFGDSLAGSATANVISGLAGNDTIDAGGGMDTVYGGDGDDVFVDTQAMGAGDDDVYDGGNGVDTLVHDLNWVSSVVFDLTAGFASYLGNRDQLIGIENLVVGGEATVRGDAAANALTVNGIGANLIDGAAGNDTIDAGGGNDTVIGGAGDDVLSGGAGNDVIDGGTGADAMAGDNGNDNYLVDNAGDLVTESNASLATGGRDIVRSSLNTYTLSANVEDGRIISIGNANMGGNELDNVIYAGSANNFIDGKVGIDTVSYRYAGAAVTVDLGIVVFQATGGSGSDRIVNTENLTGSNSADTLLGNAGDNVLDGGTGADNLTGRDGSDTYVVDNAGDVVTETNADPSSGGRDLVRSYLNTYTLTANVEDGRIMSGVNANMGGNGLDNVIYAGAANNYMIGHAGIDTVSYLYAGAGVTVDLSVTVFQATGGSGSDRIVAFENLTGSAFADTLTGDAANNVLNGGTGADNLIGGDGNDTYLVDNAGDVVIETNAVQATGGRDLVQSFLNTYTLTANVEDGRIMNAGGANMGGNGLDNTLYAGAGNNFINGQLGSDTVSYDFASAGVTVSLAVVGFQPTGGSGSDSLTNVENLSGSKFNDMISGNAGPNELTGGAGSDNLIGGGAADRFVLDSLLGSDNIGDFVSGLDKVVIGQSGIPVGNGDTVVNGATTVAGPGGFSAAAELVVVTGNIGGALSAASAAAAIGSAAGAYAVGQRVLFAVDNGVDSALMLFSSMNADALVDAAELSLLAMLSTTPSTTVGDYVFGG